MCGVIVIAGNSAPRMSGESVFAALRHRGPDSFGYEAVECADGLFEFGHTRLAIQDLSPAGGQPMWSADRRWLLSFNGEIYNHQLLRAHLTGQYGTRFRGHSDTETLVELIAREGVEETVARLDGMFAFVALDRTRGRLFAARDAAGIKPLYYVEADGGIAFSSEVRGLTAHGFDPGPVDPVSALTYLQFRYVPSPATLYRSLRRVPAGTIVSWQAGQLEHRHFRWRPPGSPEPIDASPADPVSRFGDLLERSVRDQLISDVPVGVLLSGGLDSAAIAVSLTRAGVTPPCFTVGFDDDDGRSEIEDAAETARLLKLPHYPLRLSIADLLAVEARTNAQLEEPLGTTSALAMWHLCKLAREHVTVALAGQGADEPLGGYRRHRLEALRARLPSPARRVAGMIASVAGAHGNDMARAMRSLSIDPWLASYADARQLFTAPEIRSITGSAPTPVATIFAHALVALRDSNLSGSDLHRSLWLDTRTQLPDDLLLYGDKIAMAHSLEVRVPFLGAPVLAYLESLPDEARTAPWQSKRVLRRWASRVMPEQIIRRPKRGFLIPNLFRDDRFMKASQELVRSELGGSEVFATWDTDRLVRLVAEGTQGGAAEVRAWSVHSLARWLESRRNAAPVASEVEGEVQCHPG